MRLSAACAVGLISLALAAPPPKQSKRARKVQFLGINESGAEFGSNIPGMYGQDYTWPDVSTIPTFINKGMNVFRVSFLAERLTPGSLTGAFDKNYLGNLTQTVHAITKAGAYAMINPHNYGRFEGNIITSTSDFETFWKNIATVLKSDTKIIFDTNNEFHDMSGKLVADLNQAAINGIRAAGATSQIINVEGNAYTGAWTWTTATGTDGLTNAQTMGSLTDPSNKIVYQMHQYLDSDGSGTSSTCVSTTIGSARLVAATNWLRANKKKGIIGEMAAAVNPTCEAAVKDMLSYIDKNSDVWIGAIWWAAGPWWGSYMFSVEPKNGPAYTTYVPLLQAAE